MKAVLLSIRAKYCERIANGKKTVDVRKTRPKIDPPFKYYIYCTKRFDKSHGTNGYFQGKYCGRIIGEFVCDSLDKFTAEFTDGDTYEDIRCCYLDECNEEQEMIIVSNEWDNPDYCWLLKESCLSFKDLRQYIGENFHDIPFYGWRISDLVIYDEPKELSEFGLKRPPQSWCYVEELG